MYPHPLCRAPCPHPATFRGAGAEAPPRVNVGTEHSSARNRLKLGSCSTPRDPLGQPGGEAATCPGGQDQRRGLWQSCLHTGQCLGASARKRQAITLASGPADSGSAGLGEATSPQGMLLLLIPVPHLGVHEAPTLSVPTGSRRRPHRPLPKPQLQAGPVTPASASPHRQEGRWPWGPTVGTAMERTHEHITRITNENNRKNNSE